MLLQGKEPVKTKWREEILKRRGDRVKRVRTQGGMDTRA